MNILAIVAGIPVLVAVYGVVRRQRFFFLLGYLLYALIVVPNELGQYMATGSMERLAVAVVWILQGVLAFPNTLNYDGRRSSSPLASRPSCVWRPSTFLAWCSPG